VRADVAARAVRQFRAAPFGVVFIIKFIF